MESIVDLIIDFKIVYKSGMIQQQGKLPYLEWVGFIGTGGGGGGGGERRVRNSL